LLPGGACYFPGICSFGTRGSPARPYHPPFWQVLPHGGGGRWPSKPPGGTGGEVFSSPAGLGRQADFRLSRASSRPRVAEKKSARLGHSGRGYPPGQTPGPVARAFHSRIFSILGHRSLILKNRKNNWDAAEVRLDMRRRPFPGGPLRLAGWRIFHSLGARVPLTPQNPLLRRGGLASPNPGGPANM